MKWASKVSVVIWRWFTGLAWGTEVQHSRPGQRRVVRLMCSEVQRWLVVSCLSSLQSQRFLSQWQLLVVVPRRRWVAWVAWLERPLVLAEIHWDEDQTVTTIEYVRWRRRDETCLNSCMIFTALSYIMHANAVCVTAVLCVCLSVYFDLYFVFIVLANSGGLA